MVNNFARITNTFAQMNTQTITTHVEHKKNFKKKSTKKVFFLTYPEKMIIQRSFFGETYSKTHVVRSFDDGMGTV